jgi:large subunit ribosomal protein L7Ae
MKLQKNNMLDESGPLSSDYEKREKYNSTGNRFFFKKDLSRFVKWPKYIKIQRQRRVFCQKLKIPPAIFQFTKTLDKNMTNQIFNLVSNYKKNESQKKLKSFKKKFRKFTN